MISSASSNTIITGLYGHKALYDNQCTVVWLFEAQAVATPSKPAVTFGRSMLTYGELDQYATGIASVLRRHGVASGDLVPLIMDGGLALPVAMIATMKIGAPFVPVDEAWPEERIRTILAALNPVLVLTTRPDMPTGGHGARWLCLDMSQPPPHGSPGQCPPATAGDLAYGFFTSGSTGTPKCTLNRQLGLLNRFLYMTKRFGTGHVVLQNSHHAFDSSLWQLLWPLTNGGQVVIPDRACILDLTRTIEVIARHGVTMTDFVPSIFNTLVEMLAADPELVGRLSSLRHILIGGEEVGARAVHAMRGLMPGMTIMNTYGATEASIGSLFHEITAADGDAIPIGSPIDNTYAVILDDCRKPLPLGQIGEIFLGGLCLGAGYLENPDMTAAAFIDNPVPEIPGPLLYRTGDLGYQREDGLFMFAGRTDQQVKLGGVRIELPEVESALMAHPAVREAKVIVHGEGQARRLVGFVAVSAEVTPSALAEHVRSLLPGSLVPRRIVLLDRMPLTQNGKVDRKELSRMARRLGDTAGTAGMTSGERAVKALWLDLLSCDDVGTTESLFDAGGNSLTAQRLALALERRFGVRITIRDVVAAPTIQGQASLVADGQRRAGPDVRRIAAALHRDVRLDKEIARDDHPGTGGGMGRVLLTGATGFVGVHLLHELVAQRPDGTVYCLVRADSAQDARHRLVAALGRHAIPAPAITCHVVAIPGDLTLPYFGLQPAQFDRLAESVDTVVHSAAMVNLVLDYASHRAANVAGTSEILRLAARGVPKHLHYISTLSVFPVPSSDSAAAGEHESSDRYVPLDGYSQSKWVAEKILALARDRGIPSTVYRLGEVMPHSGTGIPNARSVLHRLLHTCVRLGLRFVTPAVTDWTPVDKASEFIVKAAAAARIPSGYLHVLQPWRVPVAGLMKTLGESMPLREVTYPEFWSALDSAARAGSEEELYGLLGMLPDPRCEAFADRLSGVFTDAAKLFLSDRATCLAEQLGVAWSMVPDSAVAAYLRRCAEWPPTVPPGRRQSGGEAT